MYTVLGIQLEVGGTAAAPMVGDKHGKEVLLGKGGRDGGGEEKRRGEKTERERGDRDLSEKWRKREQEWAELVSSKETFAPAYRARVPAMRRGVMHGVRFPRGGARFAWIITHRNTVTFIHEQTNIKGQSPVLDRAQHWPEIIGHF